MKDLIKVTLGMLLVLEFASTAQAQHYNLTDLGTLPGGVSSQALAINDLGQVVGAASVPEGTHAFLWTDSGGMQDLGTLPGGGAYSIAAGINVRGKIAGSSDFTQPFAGNTHAFVWTQSSGMQDLGTLGCPDITGATGINFFSEVVGISTIPPCPGGGLYRTFIAYFRRRDGAMQSLGTLPGGGSSSGSAINFFGHVVGFSSCSPCAGNHAFLWTKKQGMQDLGTLPEGTTSAAEGINFFDSVVGVSDFQVGIARHSHAILWREDAGMIDLGALPGGNSSFALGINDRSEVVGDSQYANNYGSGSHAFIWSKERGMRDLNDLIPSDSKWMLSDARAINNRGQIVGSGTVNQQTHAFLLTPLPLTEQ
jgi:probable HAF family extracellular repeat protein